VNAFTAEALGAVAGGLTELRDLSDDEFAVFLEPPAPSDRIVTGTRSSRSCPAPMRYSTSGSTGGRRRRAGSSSLLR
jgi:hypothetical protein